MRSSWSTDTPVLVEDDEGSTYPAVYYLAESLDGPYVPMWYARTPMRPFSVRLSWLRQRSGGIGWLRQRVQTRHP